MSSSLQEGLSEAETDALAARLAANPNSEALSLEAVDGLFCALIASPRSVMPRKYLPEILGGPVGEAGMCGEFADAQELMGLLMRYWNSVVHDFAHETVHLAHIEENGVDGIQGRAWARGYMHGTRLASEGWSRIFSDESEGLVLTIPVVAGEVDPEWPKEPISPERNDELLQSMLAGAARAYRYFKEGRLTYARAAAHPEPYERVPRSAAMILVPAAAARNTSAAVVGLLPRTTAFTEPCVGNYWSVDLGDQLLPARKPTRLAETRSTSR